MVFTRDATVVDDLSDGWFAEYDIGLDHGVASVIQVRIVSRGHSAPLAAKHWRGLKPGEALACYRMNQPPSPMPEGVGATLRAAFAYVDALGRGSIKPAVDVAVQLVCTPEQAREHIRNARIQGFLTGGGRGRIGGALTPEAFEAIEAYA